MIRRTLGRLLGTLILLATCSLPAQAAFDACRQHFPGAVPALGGKSPGKLHELCFDGFAVLYSGETRTPVYVAERLNRARIATAREVVRPDRRDPVTGAYHDPFHEETRVPFVERGSLRAYSGSGFQRGHMAPAVEMPTSEAMLQSFSLANIIPQAPEMNMHAWAEVEKATRKYITRAQGDVFIITGPAFVMPRGRIGGIFGVTVPSHVFKLVYDATTGQAWAFWMENKGTAVIRPPISYSELVELTGVNFLPGKGIR